MIAEPMEQTPILTNTSPADQRLRDWPWWRFHRYVRDVLCEGEVGGVRNGLLGGVLLGGAFKKNERILRALFVQHPVPSGI